MTDCMSSQTGQAVRESSHLNVRASKLAMVPTSRKKNKKRNKKNKFWSINGPLVSSSGATLTGCEMDLKHQALVLWLVL